MELRQDPISLRDLVPINTKFQHPLYSTSIYNYGPPAVLLALFKSDVRIEPGIGTNSRCQPRC